MKYSNIITPLLNNLNQRWKVVAVLANKHPIAIATNNLQKTHPIHLKTNPLRRLHAEICCLRNAPPEKIEGSSLYVVRKTYMGYGLAKPCPICEEELRRLGVRKVIFSTNFGFEEMVL